MGDLGSRVATPVRGRYIGGRQQKRMELSYLSQSSDRTRGLRQNQGRDWINKKVVMQADWYTTWSVATFITLETYRELASATQPVRLRQTTRLLDTFAINQTAVSRCKWKARRPNSIVFKQKSPTGSPDTFDRFAPTHDLPRGNSRPLKSAAEPGSMWPNFTGTPTLNPQPSITHV